MTNKLRSDFAALVEREILTEWARLVEAAQAVAHAETRAAKERMSEAGGAMTNKLRPDLAALVERDTIDMGGGFGEAHAPGDDHFREILTEWARRLEAAEAERDRLRAVADAARDLYLTLADDDRLQRADRLFAFGKLLDALRELDNET